MTSDPQAREDEGQVFHASRTSQMAKMRKWLWISPLLVLGGVVATGRFRWETVLPTITLLGLLFGLAYWSMRKHFSLDQKITLDAAGIESLSFQGKAKRFLWRDIAEASVETIGGAEVLQLRLAPSSGVADKRSFVSGTNRARPYFALAPFAPQDQERLLDAIQHHLGTGPAGRPNHLVVEREFQERLEALAPTPWVSYAIVGLNAAAWLATVALGAGIFQAHAELLFIWGGNAASEVQQGQWWRLLSATFLHSGILHLAMNMIGLLAAGVTVERIYGHRLFALIYLGSALVGSALSLHFSAQKVVSVGASGAVFGVAGALLVAVFQHRQTLPKVFSKKTLNGIGFFVAYSLFQGFAQPSIDNAAHIGGLLGGCVLAFVLPERFDMAHFRRQMAARSVTATVLVLVSVVGLAASAPPAAVDQRQVHAGVAALQRGLKGYDAATQALQKDAEAVKAGTMTELAADERSRTVHAPAFAKVATDLSAATVPAAAPGAALLKDLRRQSELLSEALAMQSIVKPGVAKPEPADPVRMAAIEAEMAQINARVAKANEQLNRQKKKVP